MDSTCLLNNHRCIALCTQSCTVCWREVNCTSTLAGNPHGGGGALNSREAILLTSSVLHCITSKYLLRKPAAHCMSMNLKTEIHLT